MIIKKRFIFTTLLAVMFAFISPFDKEEQQASAARVLPKEAKMGTASWYSQRSPGIRRRTANNELFNDQAHTAAMWGVPFNQKVRVTNLDNGKSIIVRVNDRGPHKRFKTRVIDLTKEAFSHIGSTKKGLINVKVEFL